MVENEQEKEGTGYFQLKQKEDNVKCWCLQEEEMEHDKNAGETEKPAASQTNKNTKRPRYETKAGEQKEMETHAHKSS